MLAFFLAILLLGATAFGLTYWIQQWIASLRIRIPEKRAGNRRSVSGSRGGKAASISPSAAPDPLRELNRRILLGDVNQVQSLLQAGGHAWLDRFDALQLSPRMYLSLAGEDIGFDYRWPSDSRKRNAMGFCHDDLAETLDPSPQFFGDDEFGWRETDGTLVYPPVTLSILSATRDIVRGRAVSLERFEHVLDLSPDQELPLQYFFFLAMFRRNLASLRTLMKIRGDIPEQSLDALPGELLVWVKGEKRTRIRRRADTVTVDSDQKL